MKIGRFCNRKLFACVLIACLSPGVCLSWAWADQVYVDSPLRIEHTGTNTVVRWQLPTESSTNLVLQCASDPGGPWSTITNAPDPFVLANPTNHQFYRAAFALPADGLNESEIMQLIRNFALSVEPDSPPSIQFDILIEPIRDLWEELGVQVYVVSSDFGYELFSCFVHEGTVISPYRWPLSHLGGSEGLNSGLVSGESFYYTYSEGSGIRRAYVGKLQIVNGEMKTWSTGDFLSEDWSRNLYLSRVGGGVISVKSGEPWASGGYFSFNGWYESQDFGWIDESDSESTKLRGMDGSVIATFMPVILED